MTFSQPQHHFSQAEAKVRAAIAELAGHIFGKEVADRSLPISTPPANVAGDFCLACFELAKALAKPPAEVAKQLAEQINAHIAAKPQLLTHAQAAGPYVNIAVEPSAYAQLVLREIKKAGARYGQGKPRKPKRVMIEYFSPNTNKPLTIGHLRNITLGWSVARLLKFLGHKVIESTIYNDRGIAIAKTILAYQRWGNNATPQTAGLKPDHFVGSFYVRFNAEAEKDAGLEQAAQQVLQLWEQGDAAVIGIWQKLLHWVLEGFSQTLKDLGVGEFDERYYESEMYQLGKEVVEQGLRTGVFTQGSDGVVLAKLEKYGLPDKVVLRSDGTSVYITQDLHLASLKAKHDLDASIYVVASEQDLYLKQVFKIIELLNLPGSGVTHHLSYGMIRLPDGKIKSRQGLVSGTGADEVIAELKELARQEISKRQPEIDGKALEHRSRQIALAALKFYILQVDPKTTMIFDPHRSIALTGHTGPYVQYVHARISSIFEKSTTKLPARVTASATLVPSEFALIKILARFPSAVADATERYAPSILADYLYELARTFSVFYEQVPVLQAEVKLRRQRLLLLQCVATVLRSGLELLGIEAPEKM